MVGQGLVVLIITIVIISAVVGAIAQFLNKLNEAKVPPPRRPGGPARADATRQADRDMDRFLAEIDRLRRKNAEVSEPQAQPAQQSGGTPSPSPARPPVARPVRAPRVVAELVEPEPPRTRRAVDTTPMAPPPLPVAPGTLSPSTRVEDLPVATVVTPTSATGAPATRVTRLPQRARPAPKTELARSLTGLLNSGQGVAMAIILQEVLGPPKCKPRG
jgi:hypothetical protein